MVKNQKKVGLLIQIAQKKEFDALNAIKKNLTSLQTTVFKRKEEEKKQKLSMLRKMVILSSFS